MAQYRQPNPYDPHFALPGNVLAEAPGRGTLVTQQIPRKTFFAPGYIPAAWNPNFAVPKYAELEPEGRGAIHTHPLRRKTIPTLIPDALGDDAPNVKPGFPGDPFKRYGEKVSEYLLRTIKRVPPEFRQEALGAVLDELEPGLYAKVAERANKYKARGMNDKKAVEAAIASATSEGLVKEVIKIGETGRLPAKKTLAGLSIYPEALGEARQALGFSITGAISSIGSGIKKGASAVGSGIKKGATTAYGWGSDALSAVKGLTCTVLNSPVAGVAAGAAAVSYGAPPQAGTAGAQIASSSLCPKGQVPSVAAETGAAAKPGLPSWVLPAGIGAAGLVAVLLLTKR